MRGTGTDCTGLVACSSSAYSSPTPFTGISPRTVPLTPMRILALSLGRPPTSLPPPMLSLVHTSALPTTPCTPSKKSVGFLLGFPCGSEPRRCRCPPFSPCISRQGRRSCPPRISSQVQDTLSSWARCLVLLWWDILSCPCVETDQGGAEVELHIFISK
jgi:hypothetical protein